MLRLWIFAVLICSSTVLSAIRILTLGDWGADPNKRSSDSSDADSFGVDDQIRVANAMETYAAANGPIDFIVSLGDNFYPNGVTGINDTRWQVSWSDIYNGPNIGNVMWYSSLGNHDHYPTGQNRSRCWNQVDFTNAPQSGGLWYLPNPMYEEYIEKDGIIIHMVVIDSDSLNFQWASQREDQMAWFNQTLYSATQRAILPDWTFIVAHHPAVSCGRYSPSNPFIERNISTIIALYDNLDNSILYMNGHDHNQQHFITNQTGGIDYMVLGSGGKGTYEKTLRCQETYERGYTLQYFTEADGFAVLIVEKDELLGEYMSGFPPNPPTLNYTFTKTKIPKW